MIGNSIISSSLGSLHVCSSVCCVSMPSQFSLGNDSVFTKITETMREVSLEALNEVSINTECQAGVSNVRVSRILSSLSSWRVGYC